MPFADPAPPDWPGRLDVTVAPPWLRPAYDRVAVVSHHRHLAALDPADPATLVVATDWLLWQRCLAEGRHAVHFEHQLAAYPPERPPVGEMMQRNCVWPYDGARDVTRVRGVSLGLLFVREMALFAQACERLYYGIERLCRHFSVRTIALHGVYGDLNLIDEAAARLLLGQLAAALGVAFVDRTEAVAATDPDFPCPPVFVARPPGPAWHAALRALYTRGVGLVSAVAWRWRGRPPKVLLLLDVGQALGLLGSFADRRLAPVVDAGASPKSRAFLGESWRRGILPVGLPGGRLDRADRAALAAIGPALEQAWAGTPADPIETMRRDYVRRRLIGAGRFAEAARMVVRHARLLDRHRFARIVVGDADFNHGRVTACLARARGIPVDEIFNGIFITDWRTPSRCGTPDEPPVLARILGWGEATRSWVTATESPVPVEVTGTPSVDTYRPLPARPGPPRRVLILPPYSIEIDPAALNGRVGQALVEMGRMLRRRGFEIRVKVHPGHANPAWYQQVFDRFGIEAQVFGAGSVRPHLDWADLVIGPPTTGAMAESLAGGRPYYPFVCRPTCLGLGHMPFLRVFFDTAELEQALAEGWAPDCARTLAHLCGTDGSVPASRRIWAAISAAVIPPP